MFKVIQADVDGRKRIITITGTLQPLINMLNAGTHHIPKARVCLMTNSDEMAKLSLTAELISNLLQSMFGADSKFLMADVKHGKNNEALNHLGIATFSEELRRAVITSRTRFSKLDSNSYQLTLEYFFNSID
jgi:hypothetical protein